MNANSQWDSAQSEWRTRVADLHRRQDLARPHPTGHLPIPEGQVVPVDDEPMPDYDAGDASTATK